MLVPVSALKPTPIRGMFNAGKYPHVSAAAMDDIKGKYGNSFDKALFAIAKDLAKFGVNISPEAVQEMYDTQVKIAKKAQAVAMDGQITVTTPSMTTPIQFLQNWMPGFVNVITWARKSDEIMPLILTGDWADEQIVQGVMELTGNAVPYGDYTRVPLSSWNANYVYRNVVRFESGMMIGRLEAAQAAKANINSDSERRNALAQALDIERNYIAFYGYNSGNNLTYGFLNDPGLPAYITAATGAGGQTTWVSKTFLEIVNDIKGMFSRLRNQSGDQIDTYKTPTKLTLATVDVDLLNTVSDFNMSVMDWLKKTYPNCTVESAPELNGANGGQNVGYLYALSITDGYSTDGGAVLAQMVQTKFMTVGVAQEAKAYIEDYLNATAGVMVKRPWGVQ